MRQNGKPKKVIQMIDEDFQKATVREKLPGLAESADWLKSSEFEEEQRASFAEFDADQSGGIDLEEFRGELLDVDAVRKSSQGLLVRPVPQVRSQGLQAILRDAGTSGHVRGFCAVR